MAFRLNARSAKIRVGERVAEQQNEVHANA
jgi:hypothetical protein